MRLSIRVKQIVGVTAIVGLAVVALSALYTNRLANVVLQGKPVARKDAGQHDPPSCRRDRHR